MIFTSIKGITIPEGVTVIGNHAFSGCKNITHISLPTTVTSMGDSAFSGCAGLISCSIPAGVTSIGYHAFYGCKKLTIHAPAGSVGETYARNNHIPFVAE